MKQRKIKAQKQDKARSRPGIKNVSHAFPYTARYNRWKTEHHTKLSTKDGAGAKLFLKEGKEGTVITDKNLGIQERKTKRQQRRSTGRSDTKIREKSFLTISLC